VEQFFYPIKQRYFGIGIMTANKQNVTMNQYKDIGKVCKSKPLKAEH
jgi:hypothetical protein